MTIQEVINMAQNGDIGAMLTLGDYFMSDESRDTDEAKRWYIMAAEREVPHAVHMAALVCSINAMGGEAIVEQPNFDPRMVEFLFEEWKDAYKWISKTIEYKEAGAPNLENVDLEKFIKEREEAAYKCGIYCFYMDRYDEAIGWVNGLVGPRAELVRGISLFQKATNDDEHRKALPFLEKVVCNRAFLSTRKNRVEENVVGLAGLYVGHTYQIGKILVTEPNLDKAIDVLQTVYNSLRYNSEKDMLAKKISEIQAKKSSSTSAMNNNGSTSSTTSSSSGGCYVATAVYGSYDCPQVWTLRRYRDNVLASTWYGRAFVRTYYAVSPTLVKWFGHTEWFKNMWKEKLDCMVESLQNQGFENTPYDDRQW